MRTFSTRSALRFGLRALLIAPVFLIGETCTKLTEVPHDALTPTTAFHTDAEVLAGVAGVYAQLRAIEWVGYITLEDLTTDAAIVPTRGSDCMTTVSGSTCIARRGPPTARVRSRSSTAHGTICSAASRRPI